MTHSPVLPTCLLAALACGPLSALATPPAPPTEPVDLDRVSVLERRRHAPATPTVAQERERLQRLPGGSNLIELERDARRATLRDVLDNQPGLVVQDFFGGLDQPRLNVRGSGIQSNPVNRGVQLLQDGLPMNEADGSFIIGLLELRNAAFVSARRGANAITPAATTLGGEIDVHALTGADEGGQLRVEGGSFGRRGGMAAYGQGSERGDWRLSASSDHYDGWRHHSDGQRQSVQFNTGWRLGESVENRTWLGWTDLFFHIPSVVPKARVYSDPRGVLGDQKTPQDRLMNVYQRDPRRSARQWRAGNRTQWQSGDSQQSLGLWWQSTDDMFNNTTVHNVTRGTTRGAQYDWQLTRPQWDLRLALAYTDGDNTRDFYANNPRNGTRLQRFGHYRLGASSLDLIVGAGWKPAADWQLLADTRWSRVRRDAREQLSGRSLDQHYDHASPRLGAIWQPGEQLRLFANLSRSQEVPSWWEIVTAEASPLNPLRTRTAIQPLRVQRADTLEAGGDGQWRSAHTQLRWQVALYRSEVDDELMSMVDAYGNGVGTYNYAAGTRHQGIEAGLGGHSEWGPGQGIDYQLAWTYSDFRFEGGPYAGNQIAGIPRHLISAQLLWAGDGWRAGPTLRWLPQDTPTDHANTPSIYQESYALIGFRFEYAPATRPWSFYVTADNLTDERYASSYSIRHQATAAQPGFLPGLGRSIGLGLGWRF